MQPIFIHGQCTDGNEVFLPLVLWRRNWKNAFLHTIVPVGYSDYDYHDPIFRRRPANLNAFWAELRYALIERYRPDTIRLPDVHDEAMELRNEWVKGEPCPYLSLEHIRTNDELMQFFKPSLRGDIRRQMRRLSEKGPVTLKEYTSEQEARTTFDDFIRQHSIRWPNAYKAPGFHDSLIADDMLQGCVHFSSLNVGQTPVAWHLGFSYRGVYYYYMPAGDQTYANFSPVKIHLYYLIDRAISHGYNLFDHLRGEENYKFGWANGCSWLYGSVWENPQFASTIKRTANDLIHKLR